MKRKVKQYVQPPMRIMLIIAAVLCLLFVLGNISKSRSSLAAVITQNSSLHSDARVSLTSRSEDHRHIQRGDWEPPDVLVLVDNEEWRKSVELIVSAAEREGTPAYVLTDYKNQLSGDMKHPGTGQPLMFSYDTPWIRDYGPIQLKSSGNSVQWLDFSYADDRPLDDTVPRQLAEYMDVPVKDIDYYLEGGALISNGMGLCAMTYDSLEKALVNSNDPEAVAAYRQTLGCSALAILPALSGESTGHADIIAQFYAPELAAVSAVSPDIEYDVSVELDEAAELLLSAARSLRQRLRVIRVPMLVDGPDFYSYVNGTRLRKTYLVPSFDSVPDTMEEDAYRIIRSGLIGIDLIPVPADAMVQSGGAVHCITLGLNLPRSVSSAYLVQTDRFGAMRTMFGFIRKTFQME